MNNPNSSDSKSTPDQTEPQDKFGSQFAADKALANAITSKQIDFGKRSEDYGRFRPGFPDSFYHRVHRLWRRVRAIHHHRAKLSADSFQSGGAPFLIDYTADLPSDVATTVTASSADSEPFTILDLGSGPGIMGIRMAQLFPQATVYGVDIAEGQIAVARARSAEYQLSSRTHWSVATAEDTKLPDQSCDIVVAGQCWHWFNHELAMKELRRILKPNGLFMIGMLCYLPRRSTLAAETEQLIMKYTPGWKFADLDGLFPQQVDQLVIQGGFSLVEQFCTDVDYPFSHEGWRGRMRTCNGVGSGTLSEERVAAFDAELQQLLIDRYPLQPIGVWHRIWGVAVTL